MLAIIAFALFAATSDLGSPELNYDESTDLTMDEESEVVLGDSIDDSYLLEDIEDLEIED
jgi:hypothetical protein